MSGTVSQDSAARDLPPADDSLGERRCRSCAFWRKGDKHPTAGACFFNPPSVHMVLMQTQSPLAQAQPQVQQVPASVRPTTDAGDFCAWHRQPDEISDAEMLAAGIEEIAKWIQQGITTGGGRK